MSQTAVEQIVGKMLLDIEFRELMASNMAEALAGFDLTDTEREGFKNVDFNDFGQILTGLEERVSKGRRIN